MSRFEIAAEIATALVFFAALAAPILWMLAQ